MPRPRHDIIVEEEIPRLLALLDGEQDATARQETLRRLCPCRSECFNRETWLAIYHAYDAAPEPAVRHQAEHALETLEEHAQRDPEARALRDWLSERGVPTMAEERQRRKGHGRLTARDMPRILAAIEGEDPDARHDALRAMCPCRNRRYDREAWLAILQTYETADGDAERDDAQHALGTLVERARRDPRSQELLRWLAEQGVSSLILDSAIPEWRPRGNGAGSLKIPPPERARRSRANRRR